MNQLAVREEAERDVFDAALWYEQEREGLGFRFEEEVERLFARILDNPLQFPVLERDVRRAQMGTFPYAVFFRFDGVVATVLGVLHLHRHPKAWKRRT
jgi:plasmid stabilization system protein ParE